MAIVKMDKMTIIGLTADREAIVDALMRLGAVEIIEQSDQADADLIVAVENEGSEETDINTNAGALTMNTLSRLELAIQIAKKLNPQKKPMFSGRRKVEATEFLLVGERENLILDQISKLETNMTQIAGLQTQMTHLASLDALLEPWKDLDIDLADQGTEHVQLFLGSLDTPEIVQQVSIQLRDEAPESMIQVLATDEGGVRCAVAAWKPKASLVQAMLRQAGFNPLPVQGTPGKPGQQLEQIRRQIRAIWADLERMRQENTTLAAYAPDFELLHDFLLVRSDRLHLSASLPATRNTFWLQGWAPAHLSASIKKGLSGRFVVGLDSRPAGPDDAYPILFRNNPLVKPYEVIVEMFSPPSTRELDPTPLVAFFFFFFFGMMLSDIGYGLLLTGLCALLIYKVKAGGEMGRLARMLFLCGISSTIWGLLFGGFFGDMISVLSGNQIVLPALWFNPMDDPTQLMIWSMLFGVVHLFAGMGMKAYMLFLTGHGKDAVLDIFPWYLIIIGLGLMIGNIGGAAGQIMAGCGAGVLLLFGGRDTRNPILRLFKGLLSLYNITGYFSDILSYTRILALVLATSVIAMVVNLLGFLGGPTVIGFIFFVLAAVVGHGMNLALSALSAYVHTSRLHYVEFFGKFYEGGGRLWRPLKVRTRYTDIWRAADQ